MNEVDTARVRAMFRTFEDLERDAFSGLERMASLAADRLLGHAVEMVRAGVMALEAGRAGEPGGGLVAPGVAGARAMFEMARRFAAEARDVLDMGAVFGLLDLFDDQYEARDLFEVSTDALLASNVAMVCQQFGGWAYSRAAAAARGYDYLDDALRGDYDYLLTLNWAVREVSSGSFGSDWAGLCNVPSALYTAAREALEVEVGTVSSGRIGPDDVPGLSGSTWGRS